MSVVHSISKPESTSKKKSNFICYHVVCKSVAMGESLVGNIPSSENVANLMTKVVCGQKNDILQEISCMEYMMMIEPSRFM